MDKKLIEKINYYAKKQREQGLTPEEQLEQHKYRQQYLDEFRSNFKQMLDNIEVVDKEEGMPQ